MVIAWSNEVKTENAIKLEEGSNSLWKIVRDTCEFLKPGLNVAGSWKQFYECIWNVVNTYYYMYMCIFTKYYYHDKYVSIILTG